MLYSEFKNALKCKEKGYVIKLKYERFMQINFNELSVSAILLSDSKDFELTNTDGSLIITDKNPGESVVQTVEILVHQMKPESYDVVELCGKKHMVIIKELRDQITVDGLLFVNNRDTAIALLANFADPEPVTITIPFPEDTMNDFLEFIKSYSQLINNIDISDMKYFDNDGNPVLARGLSVNVVYDIVYILEREKINELRTTNNQKHTDKKYEVVEKIKNMRKDSDLISDEELNELLDEYASTTNDNEYYYSDIDEWNSYARKYTKKEYDEAYENLCKEIANHVGDGKVDFIFGSSRRNLF